MNSDNLELASNSKRLIAFIIDDFLVTFIFIFIYWNSIAAAGNDLSGMLVTMNSFVWQVFLLKFIYQALFVWYYGATVGKIIMKIRVIDYYNFGRVSLFTAFLRSFLRLLSEMFFYIGFLFAFFNDGRQTFHDKIGRTLVVNA